MARLTTEADGTRPKYLELIYRRAQVN